jgi:hypothetical protein
VNNGARCIVFTLPKLRTLALQSPEEHIIDETMVRHITKPKVDLSALNDSDIDTGDTGSGNDKMNTHAHLMYSSEITDTFPSLHTLCIGIVPQSSGPFKQLISVIIQHLQSLRNFIIDIDGDPAVKLSNNTNDRPYLNPYAHEYHSSSTKSSESSSSSLLILWLHENDLLNQINLGKYKLHSQTTFLPLFDRVSCPRN